MKKTESYLLKLYIFASALSWGSMVNLARMVGLGPYETVISNPILTLAFLFGYTVWINHLNKFTHIRILRGPLFHKVATKEDDPQ